MAIDLHEPRFGEFHAARGHIQKPFPFEFAVTLLEFPLDIDAVFPFDIWLTYHPDAARVPRVRRMIDWIIESFDPKVFPWFRDEFIHPRDLPGLYSGPPLVNLFEGLTWESNVVKM